MQFHLRKNEGILQISEYNSTIYIETYGLSTDTLRMDAVIEIEKVMKRGGRFKVTAATVVLR